MGNGSGEQLVPDDGARLSLLFQVSRSFSELIDLEQLLASVMAKTRELLKAESCAILLLDEERQELYFPFTADIAPEVEHRLANVRFPADQGIAGWVLQHGTSEVVPDVASDPRWYSHVDEESGVCTRSLLCAPLRTHRGILGVIELRNKNEGQFTESDRAFLDTLSGSIAVALDNARLYRSVQQSEARLREQVVVLHREMAALNRFTEVVAASAAMHPVMRLMESAISTPITVLLQGETGTGKELIARAIHRHGARRDKPFLPVNCAALTETLLESELFGYKRGAFTGATTDKKGLFEVAHGGTIFLDEIGETTPALQVKLLRVLQDGEVLPVGDCVPRHVDVRVISATNRDLDLDVKANRFRQDLYYRLSSFPINVPPLRERADDIPLLAMHLLRRIAARFNKPVDAITSAAMNALCDYLWPGNVRELENEIERAVALGSPGQPIDITHLSEKLTSKRPARVPVGAQPTSLRRARAVFEEQYLTEILRQNGGNASKASKVLGISRVMLQKKIKQYGLRTKVRPATP